MLKHILISLALVVCAGLVRLGAAPVIVRLPSSYANETKYVAETRFREAPEQEWQAASLIAKQNTQALSSTASTLVIQGHVDWVTDQGELTYETSGLYGVDRATRRNLPGYGDQKRFGQFLFPAHIEQTTYQFWDPYYSGPRTATFDRIDRLDGMVVYVFRYTADVDDTDGYEFLPLVPERYKVVSRGRGTLWIEPVSGIVVDFEDEGVSWFVAPTTGADVADMYHWKARYTPATRAAQFLLARETRFRFNLVEVWLPGGMVAGGLIWLVVALWWRKREGTRRSSVEQSHEVTS